MSYAISRNPLTTPHEVRSSPQVIRYEAPAVARAAANEPAERRAEAFRSVEPMLLVYQERAESFRLTVAAIRRGYRALAGMVGA